MTPSHEIGTSTYLFLGKSVRIVIGHPLIIIPCDPFHTSFLVPNRLYIVVANNVLDLLVIEDSSGVAARSRIGAATELAHAVGSVA